MSKVPSRYQFIDHRAPWYVPKMGDPTGTVERHVFMGRLPLIFATITFSLIALSGSPMMWIVAGVLLATLVRVWQRQNKFTVRIPNYSDDYTIRNALMTMQPRFSTQGPEARKLLEPVMVKAYACARAGDAEGVEERRRALSKFVKEMGGSAGDDSDVAELKRLIEIRREMKKDGLL